MMLVHIMAPKEGGRTDDIFEFHCSPEEPWESDDPDIETVYHEDSRLKRDEWFCSCGVNTKETEGVFVTRLVE